MKKENKTRNKNIKITLVTALIILILISIVIWKYSDLFGETEYEKCVKQLSFENGKLGPAQAEQIGATRNDSQNNIWTKTADGWKIRDENIIGEEICVDAGSNKKSCSFKGNYAYKDVIWTNEKIDRETSGIDYSICDEV